MARTKTQQEVIVLVQIYTVLPGDGPNEYIYDAARSFDGPVQDILAHLETIKGVVADNLED